MNIQSLALFLIITYLVQIIALFFQYRVDRTHHGLGWWTLSGAIVTLGFVFNYLRDYPFIGQIAIVANNVLFLSGLVLLYIGVLRFFDLREKSGWLLTFCTVFTVVIIYFTVLHDDISVRRLAASAAIAGISFLIAWTLQVHRLRSVTASAHFLSVVFLANGAFFILRVLATFLGETVESAFAPTLTQTSMYILLLVTGMLTTFGLILMVNQRVNVENRQAKENSELIFNTSPDAVVITRLSDGLFVEMNDGFFTLTGFTRADVIGRSTLDINLWKNPAERHELVQLLKEKGACENLEAVFLRKDGLELIGMVSARVILLQGVPHLISVTRDITERKRIEVEKENANARLRILSAAIEQSPVTTVITDLDGQIVFVNPKFTETTGYTAEEAIGQNPRILKTDFKPSAEYTELWSTILNGQSWNGVFHNKKKNGELYWESATISPVKDEHGTITHFLAVKEDITERKQAEEVLHENQRFLSQLIENNGAIIFAKDRAGRYELVNKKWEEDIGIQRDFAIGKTDEEIFPGHTSAEHSRSDLQVIESKGVVKAEEIFQDASGVRFYVTIKFPLLDDHDQVKGLCGISTDITERKQIETERQTILEIMQGLVVTNDLQDFLRLVHHSIAKVIYAENFFVILYNRDTDLFEEIYSVDKYDPPSAPFKLEKSASAYVFRTGQPQLMTQPRFGELIALGELELVGTSSPSWLGVPLKISNETIGVMVVQDYEIANRYSERDIDLLVSIAGQIALVVESKQAEEAIQKNAAELELFNRQLEIAVSNANEMAAQAVHAEQMIRESEARYRAVFDSASDAIISTNDTGIIFSWNHGAETIFGYPETEAVGLPLTMLMPSHFQDMHLVGMKRVQAGGDSHIIGKTVEVEGQRKDGSIFPLEISLAEWSVGNDRFYTAMIRDITERKQLEDELHHQATTDGLTGLFNRRHFEQLASAEMKRAIRLGHPLTIVLIDIDHFKHVNDTHGHAAGDQALLTFKSLCLKNIREIDIFSRFGGDEFALLLPEASSEQAYAVIERIRLAIAAEPIKLDGGLISLTISSGIASLLGAGEDFDKLLIKADQALYRAKEAGRNKVVGYDEL